MTQRAVSRGSLRASTGTLSDVLADAFAWNEQQASTDVLALRDGLKVGGCDTPSYTAEVVQGQAFGDRSNK
jgi:hypothetical protein